MTEVTYREAINRALADALEADGDVFMCGEDVGAAGGVFKVTEGLHARFGSSRVRDTPISEQAIIGLAIGAAMRGLRPVAELMFADFSGVAFDQLANQLAKYRYMTGGQVTLPVTVRLANGIAGGFGAQHSQSTENWLLNVPGLKLAVPATPADAYGLLRAAIAEDDPVLFFEHKSLLNTKGELDDKPAVIALGEADIVQSGTDVTVVATQLMRHRAVEAADELSAAGVSVEVVDPRTLAPLDLETISGSVERTGRLAVVQEGPPAGSWGATAIAAVLERQLESLDAPPALIAADPTPIAFAAMLEQASVPSAQQIVSRVRSLMAY